MTERDAFVEHEAFAAPAALRLGYAFQVAQDAAPEVMDFVETLRQQIGAGLLAADAAGAEHGDLAMPGRIELLRGEFLELAEALYSRIDCALERAHRDLEFIAGIDDQRLGSGNQRVPVGGFDIGADLPRRIDGGAERDDLLLQPDLHPLKRHPRALREFQFEIVEPAAEQRATLQFGH